MSGSGQNRSKKKILGLASALEIANDDPSNYGVVIDAISQLTAMLKSSEISLTMSEKMQVIKSVTRAKVRAFRAGNSDDYRTFRTLDEISGDLVQLL